MKNRILFVCFTVFALAQSQVFAQKCATCGPEPAPSCSACVAPSCELFGGLKNLMACRPCAPVIEPVCAPCAAPVCAPCAPVCAPICAPVCAPCAPVCDPCVPCGPLFPNLKPALCHTGAAAGAAVCRVGNGTRRLVSGMFGTLANLTAPRFVCGCACGVVECDGGCDVMVEPATPSCNAPGRMPHAFGVAAPLPESPRVAD